MREAKKLGAVMCVVALLGAAGCSDDDDGGMLGGTVDAGQAAGAVAAAMNGVAVPLVTVIGTLTQLVPPAPAPRGIACDEPIACPFGGTLQDCQTSVEFGSCDVGVLVNGSIAVNDAGSGDVSFDLAIDGLSLSGSGNISPVSCGPKLSSLGFAFRAVTVQYDGNTAVTDGNLQVCGEYPEGTLTLTTEILAIVLGFDGTSTISGTASDLSGGEVLVTCTGDLTQVPIEPNCS